MDGTLFFYQITTRILDFEFDFVVAFPQVIDGDEREIVPPLFGNHYQPRP